MSSSATRAVRMVVRGTVQGVFYRDTCRSRAADLGVDGWVENRPDGSVEALFVGAPDAVAAMVAWARQGPERAVVTSSDVREVEPPQVSGFEVR